MSAHSPEPMVYHPHLRALVDSEGRILALLHPAVEGHEIGYRIAALSQENARLGTEVLEGASRNLDLHGEVAELRKALQRLIDAAEESARTSVDHVMYPTYDAEYGEAVAAGRALLSNPRTALRAGGAEKGVGT